MKIRTNVLSLVVWNTETGEFKNGRVPFKKNSQTEVSQFVENRFPELKVIHVFKGKKPSKSYRSLPYDKRFNGGLLSKLMLMFNRLR